MQVVIAGGERGQIPRADVAAVLAAVLREPAAGNKRFEGDLRGDADRGGGRPVGDHSAARESPEPPILKS